MRTEKLDPKFAGVIFKVKDGTIVPDDEYVVFLAKDNAFAAILPLYRDKCAELGCDGEQFQELVGDDEYMTVRTRIDAPGPIAGTYLVDLARITKAMRVRKLESPPPP